MITLAIDGFILAIDLLTIAIDLFVTGMESIVSVASNVLEMIGKLMTDFDLLEPLREFGLAHAIWGTCAGAILLAKDAHREQPLLNLMDITVDGELS